ncbi:hypothetical protein SEF58_11450 [Neomoorella humiferrea]|uniref:Ppx/GppA phosphatase family protein n=1 Tax=Neomoorella humiferrea TaxID=676965 RepID=UPI003D914DA1
MAYYAALDVGSNSVRLMVGEVREAKVYPVRTALRSTRLLAGAVNGWLQEEAVIRTAAAVAELAAVAREWQPAAIICIATSAAREARNLDFLRSTVKKRAGLELTVIEGETEARLAYEGALAGFEDAGKNPLVIDIGGGSTELSWMDGGRLRLFSVRVGAVRATETAMTREMIAAALAPVLLRARGVSRDRIIGTGGTITTAAAMELGLEPYLPERVHGTFLTTARVKDWRSRLEAMPLSQRRLLPGLQPERADIIVAGLLILEIILEGLGAEGVVASEADLLWGLILNYAAKDGGKDGKGCSRLPI